MNCFDPKPQVEKIKKYLFSKGYVEDELHTFYKDNPYEGVDRISFSIVDNTLYQVFSLNDVFLTDKYAISAISIISNRLVAVIPS